MEYNVITIPVYLQNMAFEKEREMKPTQHKNEVHRRIETLSDIQITLFVLKINTEQTGIWD